MRATKMRRGFVEVAVGGFDDRFCDQPVVAVVGCEDRIVSGRNLSALNRDRPQVFGRAVDDEQGQRRVQIFLAVRETAQLRPVEQRIVGEIQPPFGQRRVERIVRHGNLKHRIRDLQSLIQNLQPPQHDRVRSGNTLVSKRAIVRKIFGDQRQAERAEQFGVLGHGLGGVRRSAEAAVEAENLHHQVLDLEDRRLADFE